MIKKHKIYFGCWGQELERDVKRINKINKYLIAIKDSNIIEISPENTEFYLVKNGYGKLLIENSEDGEIYDYCKCTINGSSCIRLSDKIMQKAK